MIVGHGRRAKNLTGRGLTRIFKHPSPRESAKIRIPFIMLRWLKCLLILILGSCLPAAAQQEMPRPLKFKFKAGQTVWLEAYEFPSRFEGLILQVMVHGDKESSAGVAIIAKGPIFVSGDIEDLLLVGSTFRSLGVDTRLDRSGGSGKGAPYSLKIQTQEAEPKPLEIPSSTWRVFPAPVVKDALEAGFRKERKFKIAGSPDASDFVFCVLAVPSFLRAQGSSGSGKNPLLSSVLALAIPTEHYNRKKAEVQRLTESPSQQAAVSLSEKQHQLYELIKDLPWEAAALGLGQVIAVRDGNALLSLRDIVRSLSKEARNR